MLYCKRSKSPTFTCFSHSFGHSQGSVTHRIHYKNFNTRCTNEKYRVLKWALKYKIQVFVLNLKIHEKIIILWLLYTAADLKPSSNSIVAGTVVGVSGNTVKSLPNVFTSLWDTISGFVSSTIQNTMFCVQYNTEYNVLCSVQYGIQCFVFSTIRNTMFCVQYNTEYNILCSVQYGIQCFVFSTVRNAVFSVGVCLKCNVTGR